MEVESKCVACGKVEKVPVKRSEDSVWGRYHICDDCMKRSRSSNE